MSEPVNMFRLGKGEKEGWDKLRGDGLDKLTEAIKISDEAWERNDLLLLLYCSV